MKKILPAFVAINLSGCHIGNRFDVGIEAHERSASVVRSNLSGFLDKLALPVIKLAADADKHIVRIRGFSIIRDFRFPNIQKCDQDGFAALLAESLGKEVGDDGPKDTAA